VTQVECDPVGITPRVANKRDRYDREARRPHVDHLAHALRETRTQVYRHYGRLRIHLRKPARHCRHRTFVKAEYAVDSGTTVQRIEKAGFT
jgi:hypothetical protein